MSTLKNYRLPREREPLPDSMVFDELGRSVLSRLNKRFRGGEGIEDRIAYQKGQPISNSNLPRVLFLDNEVRKATSNRLHVMNVEDTVRYWDLIPQRRSTYADIPEVAVFPNEGPNGGLRKQVMRIAGIRKVRIPLLVYGLLPKPAENEDRYVLIETPRFDVKEAPFLTHDGRLGYDPEKGLVESKDGVPYFVPDSQSGLRRACRGGVDYLNFGGGGLLNSYSVGRVQLISGEAARKNSR